MNCFAPITVKNPKVSGPEFIRVPCGKCEACVQNRASQWYTRLLMQWRDSQCAVFVTLTYSDENLPIRIGADGFPVADVSKEDIRYFLVRLRRYLRPDQSRKMKYFLISEYGPAPQTGIVHRPHYHGLFFNLEPESYDVLTFAWKKGFTTFSLVTEGRIKYVSGYMTEKLFVPSGAAPLFSNISQGIGLSYVDKYRSFHQGNPDRMFCPIDGQKRVLPRYLKDRLYDDAEKAAFSRFCEERAERSWQNDFKSCGQDVEKLHARYHDIRANYVRKLRKKHKKKQNG